MKIFGYKPDIAPNMALAARQSVQQKQQKSPRLSLICPILLVMATLTVPSLPAATQTASPARQPGVDLSTLDRTVKPASDFYRFANGGWLDRTSLPADRPSVGAFEEVNERNEATLHTILERAAQLSLPKNETPQEDPRFTEAGVDPKIVAKVGRFYRVAMDEALAEKVGIAPLQPIFAQISAISNKAELFQQIARLHKMGIPVGFGGGVEPDPKNSRRMILQFAQGGLGLPDRDYYLNNDPTSLLLRQQYSALVTKLLTLAGEKPETAAQASKDVMEIETQLAKGSLTRVELRDPNALYHKMNLKGLKELTPGIEWDRYFKEIGLVNPGDMNIGMPEFMKTLDLATSSKSLDAWKRYLKWHVVSTLAPYLNRSFQDEGFRFTKLFTGQKEQTPRWRRMLRLTDGALGEALGQLFVAEAFSPEAKERALSLVKNLKSVLRLHIQNLDWMGDETKKQALRKLDAIQIKVGYPDKWRDYSGLKVEEDSLVQNVLRSNQFDVARMFAKCGKAVDRTEWAMTPPTVNAYYNPLFNEIVFPAGILQPPFFDPKADDASNYGGIGMVIGHEMTHGFDDQGRKFDADGNLHDWWTAEDAKRFAERASALIKQYSAYPALAESNRQSDKSDGAAGPDKKAAEVLYVKGELTQGENISDLGGLTIAYDAWKLTKQGKQNSNAPSRSGDWKAGDEFTPQQRFFLAFAQIWRGKRAPEMARMLVGLDSHSPNRWRVLGTLVNVPAFVEAFGGGEEATLARPGSGSVKIW